MPRISINHHEIQRKAFRCTLFTLVQFLCSVFSCTLYLIFFIVTISLEPDIIRRDLHGPYKSSSIIKKLSYIHNSSIGMKEGTGNGEPLLISRHPSVLIFWYFKQINIFICYLHTLCVLCYLCVLVFRFHAWRWCIIWAFWRSFSDCPQHCPTAALASSGRTWPRPRSSLSQYLSINTTTLSRHCWTTESPEPASPRRIPS